MKISASILAADQNNIINNLNDKKGLFDYVHIDIGDNVFCPTYGISKNNGPTKFRGGCYRQATGAPTMGPLSQVY